jgi:N-formylglutamate amidohydrolase
MTSDRSVAPAPDENLFVAHLPDRPSTPVVVSVPHAGLGTRGFEDALTATLDPRCDADLFVDQLYEGLPGGAFVRARLSRFVCDLNRDPDDVSASAVPEHPRPRDNNGRGFVWEQTTAGAQALRRPLTRAEWQARREVHDLYYAALATALDRARARFGFAILLDGHSMPSRGRAGHTDPGARRAEIVPGDRLGQSCAPALLQVVSGHFVDAGYSVTPNEPYRGGFITSHHGRPGENVHAIQIEMRRDLYMDESTFQVHEAGFSRLRGTLERLLRQLDVFDPR